MTSRCAIPGCSSPPSRDRRLRCLGRLPIRRSRRKAAALLHSITKNHAVFDGNKRLALGGLITFYGLNGRRLTLTNDAAYDLVMAVASGALDNVEDIARALARATTGWP